MAEPPLQLKMMAKNELKNPAKATPMYTLTATSGRPKTPNSSHMRSRLMAPPMIPPTSACPTFMVWFSYRGRSVCVFELNCGHDVNCERPYVEDAIGQATGTDDAGPVRCHQNRHHSVRETVQSGASGCESNRTFMSASPNDKPRREEGLCGSVLDHAGKRVRRFEHPTFTLEM